MKERPILFSGPMVRAILEGRKTQTRRVIKPIQPRVDGLWPAGRNPLEDCPYGQPGDRLWVRETWALVQWLKDWETGITDDVRDWTKPIPKAAPGGGWSPVHQATYGGDVDTPEERGFRWRPSIHIPRWASRLTLEMTEVHVQRLQEISEEDATSEGVEAVAHESWTAYDPETEGYPSFGVEPDAETIARRRLENVRHHGPRGIASAVSQFRNLWDSINGERPGCSWEANPWVWAISFRRVG